jgi:hypothetical protein
MLARLKQHALELETVGGLHLRALGDRHPRGANPFSQVIPYSLQPT